MLEQVASGVWVAESQLRFAPGWYWPIRMTVVALSNERLVVISPIAIDAELAGQLDAIGTVGYLVAPNLLHHVHLPAAKERYPNATVVAPRGLEKKQKALAIDLWLDDGVPDEWQGALEAFAIGGIPFCNEFAFYHRAGASLVLTDLVFNMSPEMIRGWLGSLYFKLAGVYGIMASSRLVKMLVKDRAALCRSIDALLDLEFETLILAHGRIVRASARERLREASAWTKE